MARGRSSKSQHGGRPFMRAHLTGLIGALRRGAESIRNRHLVKNVEGKA